MSKIADQIKLESKSGSKTTSVTGTSITLAIDFATYPYDRINITPDESESSLAITTSNISDDREILIIIKHPTSGPVTATLDTVDIGLVGLADEPESIILDAELTANGLKAVARQGNVPDAVGV